MEASKLYEHFARGISGSGLTAVTWYELPDETRMAWAHVAEKVQSAINDAHVDGLGDYDIKQLKLQAAKKEIAGLQKRFDDVIAVNTMLSIKLARVRATAKRKADAAKSAKKGKRRGKR